jgi:hypothetical protein
MDNEKRKVKFTLLETNKRIVKPRNLVKKKNPPLPARAAVREGISWVRSTEPSSLMLTTVSDMYGANAYNLADLTAADVRKIVYRFKKDILYVDYDHEFEIEFYGGGWECTNPINANPSDDEIMIAEVMGDPVPTPMSPQQLAPFKLKGEKLMEAVLIKIYKNHASLRGFYEANREVDGTYKRVTRSMAGAWVCDMLEPKLMFRCHNCGNVNCVDVRPSTEQSTAYYDSLKGKEDDESKYILSRRGLDINFMAHKSLMGKFSFRKYQPGSFQHEEKQPLGDLYACDECGESLCNMYDKNIDDVCYSEPPVIIHINMRGNLKLEELKIMGYTDHYERMNPAARQSLIVNDSRIVRKMQASLRMGVTTVPSNLGRQKLKELLSDYPGLIIKPSSKCLPGNPNLHADLSVALAWCANNLSLKEPTAISCTTKPNKHINYTNPIEWLCKLPHTDSFASPPNVVGEIGVDLALLASGVAHNGLVYCLSVLTENGKLLNNEGVVCVEEEKLLLFADGVSKPTFLNSAYYEAINHGQFSVDGVDYMIRLAKVCGSVKVSVCTPMTSNDLLMRVKDDSDSTFNIVVPTMMGPMGKIPVLNLTNRRVTIRRKLMRMLTIRNLTSTMNTESLLEYALAYCNTVYTVRGQRITNKDITYDDIQLHVVLCRAMVASLTGRSKIQQQFNDWFMWLGPIRHKLLSEIKLPKVVIEFAVGLFSEMVPNALNSINVSLGKDWNSAGWLQYKDLWDNLVDIGFSPTVHATIMKKHYKPMVCCPHHVGRCNHKHHSGGSYCKCCKVSIKVGLKYCSCCVPHELNDNPDLFNWNATKPSKTSSTLSNDNTQPAEMPEKKIERPEPELQLSIDDFLPITKSLNQIKPKYGLSSISIQTPSESKSLPAEYISAVADYRGYCNEFLVGGGNELRLPYLPTGVYTIKSFLKVLSTSDVAENDEECGLDCLEYLSNLENPTQRRVITAVVGKSKWLSVQDLCKGANAMSMNLIILHNDDVTLNVMDSSKPFRCIAHSTATKGPTTTEQHYTIATCELLASPNCPLTVDCVTNYYDLQKLMLNLNITMEKLMSDSNLNHYVKLMSVVNNRAKREFAFGYVNVIDGVKMLSYPKSNRVNNWLAGRYCVPIRDCFLEDGQMLAGLINSRLPIEIVNRSGGLPIDLEEDIHGLIKLNMASIQQTLSTDTLSSMSNLADHFSPVILTPTTDGYSANIDFDCKSFDILVVKYPSSAGVIKTTCIVLSNFNNVVTFIPKYKPLPLNVKISKTKVSTGSCLRKILSLVKMTADRPGLINLLKQSECVYGVAGAGKTWRIRNECKPEDLVVCMTRNLRYELMDDNRIKCPVMSTEKMMLETTKRKGTLWLDEATMQDYTILLAAYNMGFKKIVLLGDKQQVGYVDMYGEAGVRQTDDAMSVVESLGCKVTVMSESKRIGYPCASEIAKVSPGFAGNPDVKTSYEWHNMPNLKAFHDWFGAYNGKIDLVLCMYQETRRDLMKILPVKRGINVSESFNVDTCVKTTHAHQGSECDRALLVLVECSSGAWGLNGDANYLTSAMTRVKSSLTVVMIGRDSITNIESASVTIQGGARRKKKSKYLLKSEKHALTLDGVPQDDKLLSICENLTPYQEFKKIFSQGVKQIEYNVSTTICRAQLQGQRLITTGETVYGLVTLAWDDEGDCAVVKNKTWVSDHIIRTKAMSHGLTVPTVFRVISMHETSANPIALTGVSDTVEIRLSTIAMSRVRLLAWLAEMSGTKRICLSTTNDVLTIDRTSGCSLMAGITLSWISDRLHISHAYDNFKRKMYVTSDSTTNWLLEWLEGNSDLDGLPIIDVGWKELIFFWSERMCQAPWLSSWKCDDKAYCRHLEETRAKQLEKRFNLSDGLLDMHTLYSPHETLFVMQPECDGSSNFLIISSDSSINGDVINTSNLSDCARLINIAIHDVRCVSRLNSTPMMGSLTNDLKKLSIPATEHIKHGTEVGMMITGLVTNIKLAIAEKVDDMVWVGNYSEELDRVMNQSFPLINIRSTMGYDYSSELMMMSEAMLTCMVGKDNDCPYIYGGPLPSLVAMNNQHYSRFIFPSTDNCLRSELEIDKPRYNYCVNQYLENVKKTVIKTSYNELVVVNAEAAVVNLGWTISTLNVDQLLSLTKSNKSVYGLVPSKRSNHVKMVDGYLTIKGLDIAITVNELVHSHAQSGEPMRTENGILSFNNLMTTSDYTIVSLKLDDQVAMYSWVSSYEIEGDLITVKCPNLNLDVSSIMRGDRLITTVERRVSRKLFQTMMNRLVTKSKSRRDTIAYMRSMLSTEVTREDYLGYKFNDNPTILYDTINVAMTIKEDILGQVNLWKSAVDTMTSSPATDWLTDQVIELIMYFSESLLENVLKPAKELIMNALVGQLTDIEVHNIKTNFNDMLIKLEPHDGVIVKWFERRSDHANESERQAQGDEFHSEEDLEIMSLSHTTEVEGVEERKDISQYEVDDDEFFDAMQDTNDSKFPVLEDVEEIEELQDVERSEMSSHIGPGPSELSIGNEIVLVVIGSMGDILPLEMLMKYTKLASDIRVICHSDMLIGDNRAIRIPMTSQDFIYETVKNSGMQYYSKINLRKIAEITLQLRNQLVAALDMTMPRLVVSHLFAPGVTHWCQMKKIPQINYCPFPHLNVQYINVPILSRVSNNAMLGLIKSNLDKMCEFKATDYFTDKTVLSLFDSNMLSANMRLKYNLLSPVLPAMLGQMRNDEYVSNWLLSTKSKYILVYLNMLTEDQLSAILLRLSELANITSYKVLCLTKISKFEQTNTTLTISEVNVGLLPYAPEICVHHATAGMTHQVYRWGIQSIIIMVFADQPMWCDRLKDLQLMYWSCRADRFDVLKFSRIVKKLMNSPVGRRSPMNNDQPDLVNHVCNLLGMSTNVGDDVDVANMRACAPRLKILPCVAVRVVRLKHMVITYNPNVQVGCVQKVMEYYSLVGGSGNDFSTFDEIIEAAIKTGVNIMMTSCQLVGDQLNWKGSGLLIDMFENQTVGVAMLSGSEGHHCVAVDFAMQFNTLSKADLKEYDVGVDMWSSELTKQCQVYDVYETGLINSKLQWNQLSYDWEHRYRHAYIEPCNVGGWLGFASPLIDVGARWSTAIMWSDPPKLVLIKNVANDIGKWSILNVPFDSQHDFVLSVMNVPVLKIRTGELALKLVGKKKASLLAVDRKQQKELLQKRGQITDLLTSQSAGHLILLHYDNRSHHNGVNIYEQQLNGKITVQFNLPADPNISLQMFKASHNLARNRLSYNNAKLQYVTEFSSVKEARMEQMFLNNCTQVTTSLVSDSQLSLFSDRYSEHESVSGAKMLKLNARPFSEVISRVEEPIKTELVSLEMVEWTEPVAAVFWSERRPNGQTLLNNVIAVSATSNGKITVLTDKLEVFIQKTVTGGSLAVPLTFKAESAGRSSNKYWWDIPSTEEHGVVGYLDTTYLSRLSYGYNQELGYVTSSGEELVGSYEYLATDDYDTPITHYEEMELCDDITVDVIDMWSDLDLTEILEKQLPTTRSYLESKEIAGKIAVERKQVITKYPAKSRPVLTKKLYAERNAITDRLLNVKNIRTMSEPIISIANRVMNTFCKCDWEEKVSNMLGQEKITYNIEWTKNWILKHHKTNDVAAELENFICEGTSIMKLNDIRVHLKLESLLKTKPIKMFIEQKVRTIMWQAYFVAAIYSPIFMEAKKRFKTMLKPNVIYADGMTPKQINEMLSGLPTPRFFMATDGKKQDKQTDELLLSVEMLIYRWLGVSEEVMSVWPVMHDYWGYRSNHSKGTCHLMRLTGQSTTAFGNALVNFTFNSDLYEENIDSMIALLILGDDNTGMFSRAVDTSNVVNTVAVKYNMEAELEISDKVSTFCSFLVHNISGGVQMCPDIIRLKNRFEVPNGVSEVDKQNARMRAMSYMMTIGPTSDVTQLIKQLNLPIAPSMWYDFGSAVTACAIHYNVSEELVMANYNKLIDYLQSDTYIEYEFQVFKPARM